MSGIPQQSSGTGNGIGNMSQLAAALRAPQSGTPTINAPATPMPPNTQGGVAPSSQWTPPFGQPTSAANSTNTNAVYPQLSGGYWNQMAQMLAGPQYTPKSGSNVYPQVNPQTPQTTGGITPQMGRR